MRELPEDRTEGSGRKSVQRGARKTKGSRTSARAAASPAKTKAGARATRRDRQAPLPGPEGGSPIERSDQTPNPISPVALLPMPAPSEPGTEVDLQTIEQRLQRLEEGLRLLAGALKGAFAELTGSIESLRHDVSRTVTSEDLRQALARADLVDRISSSPAAIHAAVERLAEGIAAAQILVDEADGAGGAPARPSTEEDARATEPPPEPARPVRTGGSPDPVTIWGEENGTDPTLQDPALGPRDRRRRSGVRRRMEKSWPGRAYSQWRWRRT